MSKSTFYISCPIDTYSGYGGRSRDLVKAIIETGKYDVKIIPQRWGSTPWGFIKNNPEWGFLTEHLHKQPQLREQPDIWMQITIPNEFQPIGKFNIGVTAGAETTHVRGEWVEGVNRMHLTLVSSNHSKQCFLNSVYQKQENGRVVGEIKIEKPIEVLFEGVDTDVFKLIEQHVKDDLYKSVDSIPESFAYLYVGHWIQGDLGEDRKNTGLLVKAFYETFKNKVSKPALILKTSRTGCSYIDREEILKKIAQIRETVGSKNLPNVYLLHGEFTDNQINQLYNHPKVKAMVSLTKGEGFGRPLLEFTQCKKPIIATGWSGHTDFLNPEMSVLLGGQLTQVHPSAANDWIIRESQWFSPDHGQIGHYLKDVFENYKKYLDGAKRQAYKCRTDFNWGKMKEKVDQIFELYIPELPKRIQLQLPKLKKIELPKLEKVETSN